MLEMKPILFSTENVRALLANRKTVTRRPVKRQRDGWEFVTLEKNPDIIKVNRDGEEYPARMNGLWAAFECDGEIEYPIVKSTYKPGDILYVRETWTVWNGMYAYKVDVDDGYGPFCSNCPLDICTGGCNNVLKWRPSIHMPREAARIFLRVTGVRVERLQKISLTDCVKEGIPGIDRNFLVGSMALFAEFWNSTIKPADRALYGWASNPWVWVIDFEKISKEAADETQYP